MSKQRKIAGTMYDRVPLHNGFPSFTKEAVAQRQQALRASMEKEGLQCAILYGSGRPNSDLAYLTNWPGGREAYVILPLEGEPAMLMQLFNHEPVAQMISYIPETRWAGPDSLASLANWLRDHKLAQASIGLIGSLPFSQYEKLKSLLPEAKLVDFTRQFRQQRVVYGEEEINFFKIAAELTDRSIESLERGIKPGMKEYDLPLLIETPYLEAGGFAGIHFLASTSMKDPDICVPHQYLRDRVIQRGDVIISEISGAFWCYSGQIHRSFFLGEPTPEWQHLHQAAVDCYEAIESVLKDGATTDQVVAAADVLDERGYVALDDLLHGASQYPPILQTRQADRGYPRDFTFRENMVVTIQPQPRTKDKRMGLQFGETVRITKTGTERLHHYPRKMVVIDR
jgi:Xaa-Pro dipeptidase